MVSYKEMRKWMQTQNYDEEMISKTIKIAWESQRTEIPETIEGKILHDAYVLEGGKNVLDKGYLLLCGIWLSHCG